MPSREKIREGIDRIVGEKLHDHAYYRQWDDRQTVDLIHKSGSITNAVMSYLHSQGVVIKVERELPDLKSLISFELGLAMANGELFGKNYPNSFNKFMRELGIKLEKKLADYVAIEPLVGN